jgi:flavin-dependent dehydrogenase
MKLPETQFDAAIVGAGPAGAAAAIALARAKKRVLLIDKRAFPREKVCGGCLSGDALHSLRRLLGGVTALPGSPTREIRFVVGRHRFTCRPDGEAWLAPRPQLDACLADTAEQAGATTRFGQAATLERDGDAWSVRLRDELITARTILLASGIRTMPEQIGIASLPCRRRLVAQQWIQPATPPLPALGEIEMHWLRGGYIGLATPTAGECVVAIAAEAAPNQKESIYERLRRLNPHAAVIQTLPPDAPRRYVARGTGTFPWLPQRLSDRNLLLIGDAAGYAEPFTGEGIGQALLSAECACRAILESESVAAAYLENMKARHAAVLRRTQFISSILQWPLIHAAARALPWVPSGLFAWIVRHIHVRSSATYDSLPALALPAGVARSL